MGLIGAAAPLGFDSGTALGNSFALFLFLAGGLSLAMAGYLIVKSPKVQGARFLRRK